jgi:hypothetical protein
VEGNVKALYCLVLLAILVASCSAASSEEDINQMFLVETQRAIPILPEMLTPYTSPQPTDTTAPTATREPTTPSAVRATQVPILTPSPIYSQPLVLLEFSGTGETVTNNYRLPKCLKAVYYWSASPNSNGTASLILNLHQPTATDSVTLVNVVAMDTYAEGLSGSVLRGLIGGEYSFSIENTNEAWTIRVECQDNIAPVGTGMSIQSSGWFVSDNYVLSTCQKGIFSWSVEPNANGTASLVLYLCDLKRCTTMVNEVKLDMTAPLTGQVTAMLQSGTYFIGAENTLQPWSVSWECKD